MQFESIVRPVASDLQFPEFSAGQLYMQPLDMRNPRVPQEFAAYQQLVEQMLEGVTGNDVAYLTIDEKHLRPGQTQRRPGAHIDGIWVPSADKHSTHFMPGDASRTLSMHRIPDGGGWRQPAPSDWRSTPAWIHGAGHGGGLILASNAVGCRYWTGKFDAVPGEGGDLEHVRHQLDAASSDVMQPHTAYVCNVWGVHESIPLQREVRRQLVRITLPESVVVH